MKEKTLEIRALEIVGNLADFIGHISLMREDYDRQQIGAAHDVLSKMEDCVTEISAIINPEQPGAAK